MPSLRAIIDNLRTAVPRGERLALIRRHLWVRLRYAQVCCDHPGSAGC
ncbi:MAG TPA: hypothetical protein VIO14_04340 [Dehalococcoidia bacterium]